MPNFPEPILRIMTQDGKIIDILEDWELADPYWSPQIAKYKDDGHYVNSTLADGQRLVFKKYANVVETIPLTARGANQAQAISKIRELLQVARQAADYWTESYEQAFAWLEVRPACNSCRIGYARLIKANVPELNSPFTQPFFSYQAEAVMEDLTLIIEREPLWRGVPPGELLGPLFNLIRNSDFEIWNAGITDSQPDSWTDIESTHLTGQNSREDDSHSGNYSLKVRVSGSTAANRFKGVTQVISGIRADTTYTVVAWVRNDGVSRGVGRILVTYSSQLEIYRSGSKHGWQLYTGTFTTGANDSVAINLEILTTAANTDGTVYFDSLMLLEGDLQQEAIDEFLPYISSSHVVNHWDQPEHNPIEAGDINYVDVWSVPGDEDALVRLEVQNNTEPADFSDPVELFAKMRIGMRRTGDVFNFDNYHDPSGVTDTTASSNDRLVSSTMGQAWINVSTKIVLNNTVDNQGRFRVLARVFDPIGGVNSTLRLRLNYFIGIANLGMKTLEAAVAPIRNNWCIVNLTPNAAMVQDNKFATNEPVQLGYTIQMSRSSGSSSGYLDYALVMPTDGGYLEADIEPPLTYRNALIVDGTGGLSQSVGATQKRGGGQKLRSFSASGVLAAVKEYKGAIYFGAGTDIYEFNAGVWTLVLSPPADTAALRFEIYDGRLYAGGGSTPAPVRSTADGRSWATAFTLAGIDNVRSMKSFAGKLFLGTETSLSAGRLYEWNGTTATLAYSSVAAIADFEVYKNTLYGISLDSKIYKRDNVSGNWTQDHAFTPTLGSYNLKVFKGKMYATVDNSVYAYDGSSWTLASTIPAGLDDIRALEVLDDILYAGFLNNGFWYSEDGISWTELQDITDGTSVCMAAVNGVLYVGDFVDSVYAYTASDNMYKLSNFQGTTFASPPEKRHRFFFSYDRLNFINNADDAVLVGIGFVPRFLSLIGPR